MDADLQKILDRTKLAMDARQQSTSEISGTTTVMGGTEVSEKKIPTDIVNWSKKIGNLEYCGIYKRYQNVTFDAIERRGIKDDSINRNYLKVKKYASELEDNIKRGYGLILAGGYGTMKTTMAVAVLRQWLDSEHYGLLVPMCSMMDNLFTMRSLNREEWAKYEARLRSTPLLVLDDLGSEGTDQSWILAKVDSIITERYNKMLPVIVTTNLSKDELQDTYSARIIDRLRNTSRYISFDAESQRRHLN